MQTHVNASSPQTRRHRWLAAVAALVLTVSPALAGDDDGEPFNNTPPWDVLAAYQPHTAYIGQSGYSIHGVFAIETSGDVDYIILGCSQGDIEVPPSFVDTVSIQFTHAAGDLDMNVATISGSDYLGYSSGITDTELVTVPGKFGTVVLQVYGYAGATGSYSVHYECRPF